MFEFVLPSLSLGLGFKLGFGLRLSAYAYTHRIVRLLRLLRLLSSKGVRIWAKTARICIHSQNCKAGKIPKRVWNSPAQLVIEKIPANTMRGMVRCGCGMYTIY